MTSFWTYNRSLVSRITLGRSAKQADRLMACPRPDQSASVDADQKAFPATTTAHRPTRRAGGMPCSCRRRGLRLCSAAAYVPTASEKQHSEHQTQRSREVIRHPTAQAIHMSLRGLALRPARQRLTPGPHPLPAEPCRGVVVLAPLVWSGCDDVANSEMLRNCFDSRVQIGPTVRNVDCIRR